MFDELRKLAEEFADRAPSAVFALRPYSEEAKQLSLTAGKLHYRAKEEKDPSKAKQLTDIAKMVLSAADMLKRV